MVTSIKKIIIEYFSSLLFSIIGFFIFYGIYTLIELIRSDINFGGDKGKILFGLFFGLSIGGIFGIIIVDILFFKEQKLNIIGVFIALILSVAGSYLGTIMLDKIGGLFVLFFPIVTASMCIIGYYIGFIFK